MKMTFGKRAIDKIYHRRNRYEIPDWQRGKIWGREKKQRLIDSILRGWKLPKFYFIKSSEDEYLVEYGQQRLTAILEFFSDNLPLKPEAAAEFGGRVYSELPTGFSDVFDDFEIEFDIIEDATEEELKDFFQRLQEGMRLTSSEKLNSVHSKLRDYCKEMCKHPFLASIIATPDTRYAHFDILAKVATLEVEGLDASLRFRDISRVFVENSGFGTTSAAAKRIKSALDLLKRAFHDNGSILRTRTVVQSLITLACRIVATGRSTGHETELREFFSVFSTQLAKQVELGQNATDSDYVTFQLSVNANSKGGARLRQEILLRKLFLLAPALAEIFNPSVIAESGVSGRVDSLGQGIVELVSQINAKYSAAKGEDLFKATNKTAQALLRIRKPIVDVAGYKTLMDDLYFLFREAPGSRLAGAWPISFVHINDLRTDLRHDVDHGDEGKIRHKRRKAGATFALYAGTGSPETLEPEKFPLVQANILAAIEGDLRAVLLKSV